MTNLNIIRERKRVVSLRRFKENIITLYMSALEGEKLSAKAWKRLAKVNKIILDK